ncbi:MAG: hypothetical protein HY815_17800, partial [Candidatus Riflebacteria bacterium]|nr:hypothetical protein [Candidatus Riflebacteria bacterium]
FDALKAPPARVVWPDCAVPSSQAIEALFYPGASQIQAAVLQVLGRSVGADPIVGPGKDHAGPF